MCHSRDILELYLKNSIWLQCAAGKGFDKGCRMDSRRYGLGVYLPRAVCIRPLASCPLAESGERGGKRVSLRGSAQTATGALVLKDARPDFHLAGLYKACIGGQQTLSDFDLLLFPLGCCRRLHNDSVFLGLTGFELNRVVCLKIKDPVPIMRSQILLLIRVKKKGGSPFLI